MTNRRISSTQNEWVFGGSHDIISTCWCMDAAHGVHWTYLGRDDAYGSIFWSLTCIQGHLVVVAERVKMDVLEMASVLESISPSSTWQGIIAKYGPIPVHSPQCSAGLEALRRALHGSTYATDDWDIASCSEDRPSISPVPMRAATGSPHSAGILDPSTVCEVWLPSMRPFLAIGRGPPNLRKTCVSFPSCFRVGSIRNTFFYGTRN